MNVFILLDNERERDQIFSERSKHWKNATETLKNMERDCGLGRLSSRTQVFRWYNELIR